MATSKKIEKKAAKLLRTSKSFLVREVAGSALAQTKRRRKTTARKQLTRHR
jgi:hypothetical protein